MVESVRHGVPHPRRGAQRVPEQKQVVVIQHVAGLLPLEVLLENRLDLLDVVRAPGEMNLQHVAELLLRIDHPRVDLHKRLFARESTLALGHAQLVADQIHHVGCVALVHYGEILR